MHPRDTENAIINVLRFYEAKNAIVFCNTRAAVARLTTRFTNRGFSVVALSGELSQSERTNALQALRDGRARVCIATDVAARGIDLPNLELVIHADLPSNSDTLLHRSGRTGRAGRKGVSALIVPAKLRSKANRLIGGAKLKVEWANPPSAEEVNAEDEKRLLADHAWSDPIPDDAKGFVANLVDQFSAEQLATAFVNLYRARQSAPEQLAEPGTPADEKPRGDFGPSVWFSISVGRNQEAEPRTILPMICRMGDLTKDDVGAIRVQPSHTFVEILATSADKFTNALGPDMKVEDGAIVTKLDKAPDLSRGPKPGGPKPGGRGPKPDRGPRPDRAPRPTYDPDTPSAPRAPRPAASEAPVAVTGKPRTAKADKPYGNATNRNSKNHVRPKASGRRSRTRQNAHR